jgi:DNA-binding transcriptional ArsR family regulator
MNISTKPAHEENIARLFYILSQPVRVQILLTIGNGEACVCHLEAYLGLRQAVISQHLMILRKAGLVSTHRDGRNIFYRLARPGLLDLVRQTAQILGVSLPDLDKEIAHPVFPCPCPHCNPDKNEPVDCSHLHVSS